MKKLPPLPQPGPVALRAAEDAEANIGVHEVGENCGKWVEIYQRSVGDEPGDAWCAAFVHYRLAAAAAELGLKLPADLPASGYCPDYQDWAKGRGLWVRADKAGEAAPRRGDLCLFYFAAKHRVAHIGIVVEASGGGVFHTVEGNTGPDTSVAVSREGDGVYRKVRTPQSLGAFGGFIRLPF